MLIRKLLEIQVVQQTHQPPEIHLTGVPQISGKVTHHGFNRLRVLNMKRLLVVFFHQRKSFPAGDSRS